MTIPPDDRTLADGLRRLDVRDPLPELDPGALVGRGRRGLRRRRLVATALSSVAVVAVVAAGTALRPALSAEPGVATDPSTSTSSSASGTVEPLPGVMSGEEALTPLTEAEATRRCALRHPGQGALRSAPRFGAGQRAPFTGATRADMYCLVPGDSRPTAEGLRLATADPVPGDPAAQLRNCSVALWHDVRDWEVKATDIQPGVAASLVLSSPTGRHVAFCNLTSAGVVVQDETSEIVTHNRQFRRLSELVLTSGSCTWIRLRCEGRIFLRDGRIDPRATRIVIRAGGSSHEIRPWSGYFVLTWLDPGPIGAPAAITAYDRDGTVIFTR